MKESECGCADALEYTWQQLEGLTVLFIFDRLEGVPEALPLVAGFPAHCNFIRLSWCSWQGADDH